MEEIKERGDRSWVTNLALFGDSSVALLSSFGLLALSVVISFYIESDLPFPPWKISPTEKAYRELGPIPNLDPPIIFDANDILSQENPLMWEKIHRAFDQDGVIAVRGLLDPSMLEGIDKATQLLVLKERENVEAKKKRKPKILTGKKQPPKQFFNVNQGTIFSAVENRNSSVEESPFVQVAMMSNIPRVVANLLRFDCETCGNKTVRIMRDIFLSKDEEEYVCGWHVDDVGFWPALAEEPGNPIGINAWVALDDMPITTGGGFALAVGSHASEWRDEAYISIGSTHSYPPQGYNSSRDILQNRPGNGTCNIKDTSPHLHRRMEETKRVYDLRAGDVIFHTRWLFHRTIPFDNEITSKRAANNEEPIIYRRYSIRYGPGTSIIPPGYGTEPSVISEVKNGGRTADQVSQYDSAWYPRVWPSVDPRELDEMEELMSDRIPKAVIKSEQRKKAIRPKVKRQI